MAMEASLVEIGRVVNCGSRKSLHYEIPPKEERKKGSSFTVHCSFLKRGGPILGRLLPLKSEDRDIVLAVSRDPYSKNAEPTLVCTAGKELCRNIRPASMWTQNEINEKKKGGVGGQLVPGSLFQAAKEDLELAEVAAKVTYPSQGYEEILK